MLGASKKALLSAMLNRNSILVPEAVDFDGDNDYLSRASDLTGNSDGKTFTFSVWVYSGEESSNLYLYAIATAGGAAYRLTIRRNSTGTLGIVGRNAAGSVILNLTTSLTIPQFTDTNILVSVDLANSSNRSVYIHDVEDTSVTWATYTDTAIGFTEPVHVVGTDPTSTGTSRPKNRISHLALNYDYIDLSVTDNRRDFITADLKPAAINSTLTSGIMYLPLTDATNPGENLATGGDYTLNGVVAQSGRGPNQYNSAACTFDGGSDYLSKSSITGLADGKSLTFAATFKADSAAIGKFMQSGVTTGSEGGFWGRYRGDLDGEIDIDVYNSSLTRIAKFTSTDIFAPKKYYTLAVSFDLTDSAKRKVEVNGQTVSGTWSTYDDDTIDLVNASGFAVASGPGGSQKFGGELSDVWFDVGYTADLSGFYDTTTGKPKDLGVDGSLPTGSQPLIYLPMRGDAAGANKGTDGDFTVNSGPYPGARGPSEYWAECAEFNTNGDSLYLDGAHAGSVGPVATGAIALAFKRSATSGTKNLLTMTNTAQSEFRGIVGILTGTQLELEVYNSSGTKVLDLHQAGVYSSANEWVTVLFSFDLTDSGKRPLIINNEPQSPTWNTYTNSTYDLSDSDLGTWIGSSQNSGVALEGSVGFFLLLEEYIDFSQEANCLKFFDAFGYPVDLGEDGSLPTGSQPLIYLNKGFKDGTNLGSGSNLTPQNSPTDGGHVKG